MYRNHANYCNLVTIVFLCQMPLNYKPIIAIKITTQWEILKHVNVLDIHVPLNDGALNVSPAICSMVNLLPRFLGPWYGGDNRTIKNTIKPKTATMTKSAIKIPRQFLSFGVITTNSWKKNHTIIIAVLF